MERSVSNLNETMDAPAAMESELYVNGKVYVKSKDINKKKKRKTKHQESNYLGDLCGLVRSNLIFTFSFCYYNI
jgi:hypothetical protein